MTIVCKPWTDFGILIPIFIIAGLTIGDVRTMSRALRETTALRNSPGSHRFATQKRRCIA